MRIAIGGFQHETNTFAHGRATLADFQAADAWPGLTRGNALFEAVEGINLPVAGFIAAARSAGHTLAPLTWCSATPSGPVTQDAYEHICELLLEDLKKARDIDAVYLDLHGAMVAEHLDDADGELLRRVRALVGRDIPVVASLDFHANVSALMVSQAHGLLSYRTYPHVDMAVTGERALRYLNDIRGTMPVGKLQQLPFLIPLTSQCTLIEPLLSIFEYVNDYAMSGLHTVEFTPGFPAADVYDCGPAVFAYGSNPTIVAKAVEEVANHVLQREHDFALETYSIDQAMREVSCLSTARSLPIVLADTQDNPGGGGTASTTSLLKALIATPGLRTLAGILYDPNAAARAHAAGVGASIDMELGGCFEAGAEVPGEHPIAGRFQVMQLGDGLFTGTGPFYRGARMNLGPMALLRTGHVQIAVSSRKQQAADQAMFRHLGAEPKQFDLLALKSSVHFRADFGPIAHRILVVTAPGPNIANPAQLPFKKLRSGVRIA
ncbi:MAG: M81 family metallopeptidase [Povalibacter sp.]